MAESEKNMSMDVDAIKKLLDEIDYEYEAGKIEFKPDFVEEGAFIDAYCSGNSEVIKLLLDRGVKVNFVEDDAGCATLIGLDKQEVAETIKSLLAMNINSNVINRNGHAVLSLAFYKNFPEIIKTELLLEQATDITCVSKYGYTYTVLMWACQNNYIEIVQLLLEQDVDVNDVTGYEETALMFACDMNYIEIVKLLVEHLANINQEDVDGDTAITIACKRVFTEIVEYLESKGAISNCCCKSLNKYNNKK